MFEKYGLPSRTLTSSAQTLCWPTRLWCARQWRQPFWRAMPMGATERRAACALRGAAVAVEAESEKGRARPLPAPFVAGGAKRAWSFNGVHTTSRQSCNPTPCASPQSSIDFSRSWPVWGTSTTNAPVHAAHSAPSTSSRRATCGDQRQRLGDKLLPPGQCGGGQWRDSGHRPAAGRLRRQPGASALPGRQLGRGRTHT